MQGINDLVTPFFVVFLSEFVSKCVWQERLAVDAGLQLFTLLPAEDVENFEMSALPLQTQRSIEADTFWCMSKLLDGIQVDIHTHTHTHRGSERAVSLTPGGVVRTTTPSLSLGSRTK